MKKIFLAVIVLAAGATAFSFYADAYDPVRDKGMQTIERQANKGGDEVIENRDTAKKLSKSVDSVAKANVELTEWNKLSREEKLKLVEEKRIERRKKTDASWQKRSADKKITEYEKRLKKRAMNREERAKIEKAKLAEKCSGLSKTEKDEDTDE